jgi:hypothetical protein
MDVGLSTVQYDGFATSAAATLTPAFALKGPERELSARGTYLVFESGNRNLQGGIVGSWRHRLTSHWRAETWAGGGGSKYADFASFWHALAGVRALRIGEPATLWTEITAGVTSYAADHRGVVVLGVGGWTWVRRLPLALSASHTRIGDTAFSELRAQSRRSALGLTFEGHVGARVWSRGGGRGVFGEASVQRSLGSRATLIVGGGRFPTDPVRGSISGRYVSAAVRLHAPSTRPPVRRPPPYPVRPGSPANGAEPSGTTPFLEVRHDERGIVLIRVHARAAPSVDVAGDFTDWRPLPLSVGPDGVWEIRLTMPRGLHRVNVRLGGGAWIVPAGTTRTTDDFGGEIGVIVVP